MRKILFISAIILLTLTMCAGILHTDVNIANAASIDLEALMKQYTSTTSPNGMNIYSYINDFKDRCSEVFITNATIEPGAYYQNACRYTGLGVTVFGDDNIVKLVLSDMRINKSFE